MIYDVGDRVTLTTTVRDADGTAVNTPDLTLTVTDPDGTVTNPTATNTGAGGIYTAQVTVDAAGLWTYAWTASGTVVSVDTGQITVRAARPLIASLEELKKQLNRTDTADDDELRSYLVASTDAVEEIIDGPVAPTSYTERHYVRNEWISPRKQPLVSVTSLTPEDGTALTGSQYVVHTDIGMVRLRSYTCGWHTLVYVAGPQQLPERFKIAGLIIAQHLWQTQHGGGRRAFAGDDPMAQVPGMSFAIPRRALELLGGAVGGFA